MRERKVCGFSLLWKNWEIQKHFIREKFSSVSLWLWQNWEVSVTGGTLWEKYSSWMPTSTSHGLKRPSERYKHCLFTGAGEGPRHKNWLQWARDLAVHSWAPEGFVRWRTADAFPIFWWRRSQSQALTFKVLVQFLLLLIHSFDMAYLLSARLCCWFHDHRNQ